MLLGKLTESETKVLLENVVFATSALHQSHLEQLRGLPVLVLRPQARAWLDDTIKKHNKVKESELITTSKVS